MSVLECIAKLTAAGTIDKDTAAEALALYDRSKGEYSQIMGPADADAAAALAVSRSMETGARNLKNDVAKQALAFANAEKVVLEHPKGPTAGLLSMLSRDIWEHNRLNVGTATERVWAQMSATMNEAMTKLSPGLLGTSKEQIATANNLIRELFGVSTGEKVAADAAKAFTSVVDEAMARVQAGGKRLTVNENWRTPQFWEQQRVRKFGKEEFQRDFLEAVDSGALQLFDRETGKLVPAERQQFILERAYSDIITNDGASGTFHTETRTFQFADGAAGAEAWLKLQGKYGPGENVFGMLTGHMHRMAREIALVEVIGPNHGAIVQALMRPVREAEGAMSTLERLNPLRLLESATRAQQAYNVLTGRANAVEGPLLAGVMGGLRSISTAAQLKGAVLAAVPGDSVTAALTAGYNGMPVTRLIDGVFRELARGGDESKALAARLHLVAHGAMDYGHGLRFFQDQVAGPESFKWLATTMIRAQGLSAWTELMKRTFTMEMMGHLSDMARHDLGALKGVNQATANFLERAQITPAEWDVIRAAKPWEQDGVRFMDVGAIPDKNVANKLMDAVIDERAFAVLEPDARIRAMTTGGLPAGTFHGELARSVAMFKSFSLTMVATHMMRAATQEGAAGIAGYVMPFVLMHMFAGAVAMQAKNIVYGKDPQDMSEVKFWMEAGITSGGFGVYGDLVKSATSRTGRSMLADLGGPIPGMAEDLSRLTFKQSRKAFEGDDTTFGAEAVKTLRRYTPGTFYTRLAVDRLMFDQLQTLIDPDYRKSWKRAEQRLENESGQEFWWRAGETRPGRGPNIGAGFGG